MKNKLVAAAASAALLFGIGGTAVAAPAQVAPVSASVSSQSTDRAEPSWRAVWATNHAKSAKRLAMYTGHNGKGTGYGVAPGYRAPARIKSVLIPPGCFLMVNGYPVFGAFWNTGPLTVPNVTVRAYCAW